MQWLLVSFIFMQWLLVSSIFICVKATTVSYTYVIANSFFYIYIDIYIDIYITFTNWWSVQLFYWTPFFVAEFCKRGWPLKTSDDSDPIEKWTLRNIGTIEMANLEKNSRWLNWEGLVKVTLHDNSEETEKCEITRKG